MNKQIPLFETKPVASPAKLGTFETDYSGTITHDLPHVISGDHTAHIDPVTEEAVTPETIAATAEFERLREESSKLQVEKAAAKVVELTSKQQNANARRHWATKHRPYQTYQVLPR